MTLQKITGKTQKKTYDLKSEIFLIKKPSFLNFAFQTVLFREQNFLRLELPRGITVRAENLSLDSAISLRIR